MEQRHRLMMKKLASYSKQNGLAKALREIGRIERSLFMLDWFRDPSLRRRVYVGRWSCTYRKNSLRPMAVSRKGWLFVKPLRARTKDGIYPKSAITIL